ncbi:hypothetical protein M2444_002325 [Paenibacillus sp. PastF-3]|uniref:Gp138 family membrane-puncturing spike protein n=1 Tax=Paenibacillus sp. PastF-3 TaxID=2940626 RepID=UPI002473DC78|nr:Gp138 family membrane-puncturing spike protein [Paenibacillus sp. PastF-3]MDH6370545.1 hypothetical protein [Paenibacillus sp. PastF-3]
MSKSNVVAVLGRMFSENAAGHSENVSVALPCKVLSFNADTLTASVQPLLKLSNAEPAPISSVPFIGQHFKFSLDIGNGLREYETIMRPVLKRGDTVFVVCADAEIKNTLTGKVAAPDTARRHSRNDAVIVGVFPCSLL